LPAQAAVADKAAHVGPLGDGCYTQVLYDQKYPIMDKNDGRCPQYGICDDPGVRDGWIPAVDDPIQVVRMYFNVFAEDNGSNPAISAADLQDAVDSMNSQYLHLRLQFEYDWRVIPDSRFRDMDGNADFWLAKDLYAVDPEQQCNVFVGDVHSGSSYFSYGCFPWDPDCLTNQGGIMMNTTQMPPYNYSTLAHEMGHNLGLWHTHHGVEEVEECGACYEEPLSTDRDYSGDLCSDTYPTYITWSCNPASGTDFCSGNSWSPGEPDNIMSYVPWQCRHEFTWQQGGRMQCWTNDVLSGWLAAVGIESDTTEGPAPLAISFNGVTEKTVLGWSWDFGDGFGADQQSPQHTYQQPGLYDVVVTIETEEGFFTRTSRELIWAQGDTMMVPEVASTIGQSTRFDVYAHNSLPLHELWIPFSWVGTPDLQYDSTTTTGLRTDFLPDKQLVNISPSNRRATYRFRSNGINELPSDTGAVLSIWLTCTSGLGGQSTPVTLVSYSSYDPLFSGRRAEYIPELVNGAFILCLPGDVDGNGVGPDIADLVYLVDFMFNDGPPPPMPQQADVDGSGSIDIADLVYLVDRMFNLGPAPICGP
jgi:PKD repeat protein